jgi:hypothetical protein
VRNARKEAHLSRQPTRTLLPMLAAAALMAGCASGGFMLPGLENDASRRGTVPYPGELPYLYGYPAPYGEMWFQSGYGAWPPLYYYGPYGYGYGYGPGYGPGYGSPPSPRPPVSRLPCRDANGNGRCDGKAARSPAERSEQGRRPASPGSRERDLDRAPRSHRSPQSEDKLPER